MILNVIYPGSFDPITLGHLDIIHRCKNIFQNFSIVVLDNKAKTTIFSLEERVELIKESLNMDECYKSILVDCYSGLLTEYIEQNQVGIVIKGIRNIIDYEYELQMIEINKRLLSSHSFETLFITSSHDKRYISSSNVKEIAKFGGSIQGLVPDNIRFKIYSRLIEIKG